MEDAKKAIAAIKAQNALLDLHIKLLQDSIMKYDAMIDECEKIKNELRKSQVSA